MNDKLRISLFLTAMLMLSAPLKAAPDTGRLTEDFVYGALALGPVSATGSGYHRHGQIVLDDLLDDYSASGIAAARRFNAGILRRVDAASAGALDPEQRADLDVIRNAVNLSELEWRDIQNYRHSPILYVELVGNAVYSPYELNYAPLEQRYRHIIARLRRVPTLIGQARENLISAPEIWTRVAAEENEANLELIDKTLRQSCPAALRSPYDDASARALVSLREFNQWLQGTLAKKTSDWRLGRERYAAKFKYSLNIGKTPEELLNEAEADLVRVRHEMQTLAAPKTIEQALDDVARSHATPATYIANAKSTLAEATAFVKAKDLLTLPARSNLQVIETPQFLRGNYSVGGFSPAPALEPKLGAFYWVTPIPADWPASRIESKLREYNDSGMQHLTVHEAMPGHYVQAEYANDVQPASRRLLRSLYGNTPYVEGWAFYAQQVMADEGYRSDAIGYALTLRKQKLRMLSNAILDIRLQTMGMSDDQAIALLTKSAFQEMEEASGKLQRAKLDSTQLPSYYAGFNGWLAVREHYKSRQGSTYSLKRFHESALKEGAVPLPVLDRLLTESQSK